MPYIVTESDTWILTEDGSFVVTEDFTTDFLDIRVETRGQATILPKRSEPPPGYGVPIRTAAFTGGLEVTLDRFGRPV